MEIVKFISAEEAEENNMREIGGMGGFFGWDHPMRWKDYIETREPEDRPYYETFREYVIENNLKHGGDWHQYEGIPVFDDGTIIYCTFRAWGDLLAAIWSDIDNKDYKYMDFYMERIVNDRD